MKILKSNGISAFGGLNFVIEELDTKEIGKILNEVQPNWDLVSRLWHLRVYGTIKWEP